MKGMPTGEKPKAHYPRTSHDFSARRVYHNKVGMITPIKPIDSVPNEHFEIEVSDFLQSMPLATAAFLRGRREFAFYYVPYHQLWSNFGQYMAQRKDRYSSAMKDSKFEPRISLRRLFQWCANVMFYDLSVKYPSYIRPNDGAQTVESLAYSILTYNFHYDIAGQQSWNVDLFTLTNQRGQSFDYNISTHIIVENDVPTSHVPTLREYCFDKFGQSRWSNMVRKLDLLRYGNYLMFFSKVYDEVERLVHSETELQQSDVTELQTLIYDLVYQINLLPLNYYVEPYRILAYNKCYYTFFRNSYYELDYYVGDFNVDHLECSSLETSILSPSDFSCQFLDMYQHQWKKDLFTSLMPDTQFGAVSQFMVTSQDVIGDGTKFASISSDTDMQGAFTNPSGSPSGVYDAEIEVSGTTSKLRISNDYPGALSHRHAINADVNFVNGSISGLSVISAGDVLALRRAEAIQGYRQTLLRCGNKTKDIMVGLFGVEPVWESDHDPDFIDSFGYDYAVDRVVSTAQTNEELDTYNGKLGDLGGYIAKLGGTRRNIKYTTRGDFGVILPVCYEIIESEYNSYNIDPNILALTPEEHGIPDFMNLGFVPVTRRVLSLLDPRSARFASPYVVPNVDRVLGYGTPYYEKKIDIDLCHGMLNSFGEVRENGYQHLPTNDYVGDFAHWVAPRTDMQSAFVTTTKQFYIDPRILNNNFLLAANGRQETDQFICNTYFKVRRVNWMSDLGLPNF